MLRTLVGVPALLLALSACTSTASAILTRLKRGRTVSYEAAPGRINLGAAPSPQRFDQLLKNLDYSGGPVMHSNTNYTLFWRPKGAPAYPSDYQAGLNQYFEDLAHDSGGHEGFQTAV